MFLVPSSLVHHHSLDCYIIKVFILAIINDCGNSFQITNNDLFRKESSHSTDGVHELGTSFQDALVQNLGLQRQFAPSVINRLYMDLSSDSVTFVFLCLFRLILTVSCKENGIS